MKAESRAAPGVFYGGALRERSVVEVMEGIVTLAQESRFQLTDDQGVSHLFILGHDAAAEPDQLAPLSRGQTRVRVRYSRPENIIGLVAHSISSVR